jgi:2-iminobutanoate/2-iminopropanoate deaminase
MPKYPKPIGPYSAYRFAGDLVFLAGQIGINPDTGDLEEGLEAQTLRAIKNVANILAEIGLGLDDVVKTTVFLKDISDYPKVNEIYGRFFHAPYPARSAVAVADLPKGALVEIEVVALMGNVPDEVRKGLELFKDGEYYESHEYWEKAFRKVKGEKKTFLSGVVNVDAALIKYEEGNVRGAIINFTKAKEKVAAMFPDHVLVRELERVVSDLKSGKKPDYGALREAVEKAVKEFIDAVE